MAKQGSSISSKMFSSLPHFFQPLLPGFHNHFSIPDGFEKYLKGRRDVGGGEEDAVLMRSPSGKIYRVKMGKGRELRDGWKEFVDEHDLHVGDIVVFRLVDDPMVFDVMIFDPSASERAYLPQTVHVKTEEVVVVEEEEDQQQQQQREGEKPLPCAADVPEPETELHGENGSGAAMEKIGEDGPSEAEKPYFVVSIKPDNLKRGRVLIPRYFVRMTGLDVRHTTEVVVLDEEGRSWPMRAHYYCNSGYSTYIVRGWRAFQMENELKLGDTFNLELVQGGQNPVLRMLGLHANPSLESEYSEKARKEGRRNVDKVKKEPFHDQYSSAAGFSKMADPHFMLTITSNFLGGISLRIPNELARYGGLYGNPRAVILTNEKGDDWLVMVETSTNGITYIASGWTELVKENHLIVGDTLRIDLVQGGMNPVMTFKVVSRNTVVPGEEKP